ncbi:GGDEF domain-containing protein [Arabiibacter massiliensis]|uniref:GGDEF domain-containing protein n=1 Tax=Arabiibacter massiliensis TaxID=1870985 RepID=UPI00155A8986|nr:GGDEF domain-containing protein [Arabiibacter massiliensis]
MTRPARTSVFQLVASAALALLLAFALAPAPAAFADEAPADARTTIRVGYMDQPGVFSKDENGSFSGYTYDYLMRIAQFTSWSYEFVEAEGETSNDRAMRLIEMLDSGEVDIEGSMTYSPALAKLYEYPENSYGTAHTCLFAANTDTAITQTDLFTKGEVRVAILSTAKQRREELAYFCEKNNLNLTTVECSSTDELKEAVLAGEADAYLEIDVNIAEGFQIVAAFAGRPYYFTAPKGERAIIDEIDDTIRRINESNPGLQTELHNEYFFNTTASYALTEEDKEFCRQSGTLRVGVVSEKAPIQSFDPVTGQLEGVTKGMLDYLSEHTGLKFEAVPLERTDNLRQAIEDARVDLVAGINDNDLVASTLNVSVTAPYLSAAVVTVYNKYVDPDDLAGKKAAVSWELVDTVPDDAQVVVCESAEDCLKAVNDGRADYTYGTSYTTPYYQGLDNLTNLLTLPASSKSVNICFGLVQPIDPELLTVFNKAIRSLSPTELDSIVYDNSLIETDKQVGLFIQDHLLELSLICISVLLLIIALLALLVTTRNRAARATREENSRFQELFALSNERFFEYTPRTDTLKVSKSKTLGDVIKDEAASDDGLPYRVIAGARAKLLAQAGPEVLAAFTSPSQTVTEAIVQGEDGASQWVRFTSRSVLGDDGKPVSVIGKVAYIDDEMNERLDLSQRAFHDGLTGLLNWRAFREGAEKLLSSGEAGALLVVDTDDFKSVNDQFGHLAGDAALQNTGRALVDAFRPQDLVGRLGGDEFAVCIAGPVDHEALEKRCGELIGSGVTFAGQDGAEHAVTLSMGGVELHGAQASYKKAYEQADRALYRAKADGKDRFIMEPYEEAAAPPAS